MTQADTKNHRHIPVLVAAGLAQFLVCIDYFSVIVALPAMAHDMGVRTIDLQWVITGYVLSFSATLAVAGPLGDRYGRKKLLLLGILLFAAVSLWIGLSTNAPMVIAARIGLGVGGGLLLPLATAVASYGRDKQSLARNIALLTGIATIGTAIGPVLGGVLTHFLDWRWIFFANIPISVIAFFMVLCLARESRDPNITGRLDIPGIIMLLAGISLLSVGIDRIPHWPVAGWLSMSLGGAALMVGFILYELRIATPIINVRLFGNRVFAGYSLAGLLSNSAWCILAFLATLQLQKVLGFSVLDAGLFYLYLSGTVATASFVAPALVRRLGKIFLLRIALLAQTIGLGIMFIIDTPLWLAIGMLITGVGCAWGWAMPQAGAIARLPEEKVGLASSSILTIMIMGGNTAIVIVAMLIDLYPDNTAGEAAGIRIGFLLAASLALIGLFSTFLILRNLQSDETTKSSATD
jgi:MFS family permease